MTFPTVSRLLPVLPVLAVPALLATSAAPVAAQSSPEAVVRYFIDAANQKNSSSVAGLVSDDVVFIGGPCGTGFEQPVCVGKQQFLTALAQDPATSVSLLRATTEGSVVHARIEVRAADFPPMVAEKGIERFVDIADFVVDNGKVTRASLTFDPSDPQTVALVQLFSQLTGPEGGPAQGPSLPVARDGQSLATQPAATQIEFLRTWGDNAAAEWVRQHDAALAPSGR